MKKPVVGGQAVIEGVMMRNANQMAMAVRQPDGEIVVEQKEINSLSTKYTMFKLPILRGMLALAEAMYYGMRSLSTSAQLSGSEEEELSDKEMAVTMIGAVLFAVCLFIVIPTFAVKYMREYINNIMLLNVAEGLLRLTIFLSYVFAISKFGDIRRVFQYHGAEHKTIHAYEADEPLDVEHIQKHTTLHPRCGTSFLLIVMLVSMCIFAFMGWPSLWQRILARILLMPLVAGISYEIIRYAGRHAQAGFMQWLIVPGLMLQKLTTREPDASQIEVAIEALKTVLQTNSETQVYGQTDENIEFIQ